MTEKENLRLEESIGRILKMEECFDALTAARREGSELPPEELALLLRYYEGGQWLRDYELDERGLLPRDLKRGVLSQDGVYDFLTDCGVYGPEAEE